MRVSLIAFLLLTACSDFPKLEEARSAEVDNAPYPKLVPLDGLLKSPDARADLEEIEEIEARAEALRTGGASIGAGQSTDADRVAALRARAEALRAIQ